MNQMTSGPGGLTDDGRNDLPSLYQKPMYRVSEQIAMAVTGAQAMVIF
jgi:hypothetical protein